MVKEYPRVDEQLNIVFKKGTQYVHSKHGIDDLGHAIPYVLENVSWFHIHDDKMTIQFRPLYMDGNKDTFEHKGDFDMKYIERFFVSKIQDMF